jgi:lysophospholipase L1-like esterase
MEWYEEEVSALEQRLREAPPPAGQVAFYGSSSMRMWESLEEELRAVGALNLAFGGSTLEACVWFFERLVVPCQPRAIVCYAGDNDLGDGRTPDEVVASFRELLVKVDTHFPTIPFTMLSIKPSPSRWHLADRIRSTNEAIRRELQGRDGRYYIDIFSAMLGSDGRPNESLFLEDKLHVSPRGYQVWKRLLASRSGEIY